MDSTVTDGPAPADSLDCLAPDCFPLSFAQERIWFLEQMTPGTSLYTIAGAAQLEGAVDRAALEYSLREIVRRHEVLRTSFHQADGRPFQQIHAEVPFEVGETDLRESATVGSPGDPTSQCWLGGPLSRTAPARLAEELQRDATHCFNLSEPRLLRARLLRTAEQTYVLTLTLHHIVADGWSIGVLVRELAEFYEAYGQGRPSPLPALPIQYVDYAVWQRELLRDGTLAGGLAYWLRQLRGAPETLALPAAQDRGAEASSCGSTVKIDLGAAVSRQVAALSRRAGVTLFTTLLAAFQALLARYTGQHDIVVGSPVADRQPDTQALIGIFANLVGLRTRIDEHESFIDLLRRVAATVVEAQAYQHVPFEKVVEGLGIGRALSGMPLVQVVFAWQGGLTTRLRLGDAHGRAAALHTGTAKFDVTLTLDGDAEGIAGEIEFRTDRYTAQTIEQLGAHYVTFLQSVAASPEVRMGELAWASRAELDQLYAWSRGVRGDLPPAGTVLDLVAAQVTRAGDAVALESGDVRLTYAELDRRAIRLAARLRQMGVREEHLVGVCMDRGPDAVVAMLAVLKAGAAYVPLDPAYPPERLTYMIEDAGLRVLCTQRHLGDRWQRGTYATLVVDECATDVDAIGNDEWPGTLSPAHVAYVVYTSGSTGRPKGVPIPHRGLLNLAQWHRTAFGLGPGDRTTQVASLSFDASVWEIWSSLAAGATLCFPPPDIRVSPPDLRDWLVGHEITSCFLPTPIAERVIGLDWPPGTRLRLLLTGGDRLSSALRRDLPFALVNNYGPTESSVVATSGPVRAGGTAASCPSIGRAIRNTDVYILDDQLRPVPVGVAGEVYIGGEGLARGYWGRPDLTAARFIPDLHSTSPGARLYRTGDLACYTHDADIAFLGRCDDQIKVRGHRIEPGEIAAVLKEVPGVDEAIVQARRVGASPEPVLVAYVVTRPDVGLGRAELRQHVRRRLPDSMVPAAVVFLDRLPLTANGKIDRRALPEPERTPEQAGEPLSTPAEELVGGIWSALLGRDDIGRHSDFFELGGHSLLAAQMIVRVSAACSRDIPLKWAFEYPVLQDLATHLVNRCAQSDAAPVPAIARAARVEHLPLSFAQERIWFLEQLTPGTPVYTVAGVVRLDGAVDRVALEYSLREIVRRHEALRTSFHQVDGRPFQRLHAEVPFGVGETDLRESVTGVEVGSRGDPTSQCWLGGPLSRTAPARLAAELQRDATHCFNLSEPGLLRARLLRTGEQAYVLTLVLHHIVADGWSIGVLVRELAALYEAYGQGRPSPLPALPIQYVDYAVWQRERLRDGALAEGLAYWLRQLRGAPETLALPAAQDRGAEPSSCGSTVKVDLGAAVSRQVAVLSRREGVTLFTTLLTAFQALLARYTGQPDIVVGSPVADRQPQTQELIGVFANLVGLRTRIDDHESFVDLLRRVAATVVEAQAYQHVPFEKVVEGLGIGRALSGMPLVQVVFAWQGGLMTRLRLGDAQGRAAALHTRTAKFDLMLMLDGDAEGIAGEIEFRTDRYTAQTVAQLGAHYVSFLESVAASPEVPLRQLAWANRTELDQLYAWSRGVRGDLPSAGTVLDLVTAQVRRAGETVALESGDVRLTYAELDRRATRVAARLRRMGVREEHLVGICMDRGPDAVVAMLAVLKAGAAYVPLDPAYPPDRLTYMVEDAGLRVLCTDRHLSDRWQHGAYATLVVNDCATDPDPIAGGERPCMLSQANLAYVIYTSGSTGRPKGVPIPHRGLLNLILWHLEVFGLGPRDRTTQVASLSFDVSVWEIWSSLVAGATLCFPPPDIRLSPPDLRDWLVAHEITSCFLPTPIAERVIGLDWPPATRLHLLLTAGDRLSSAPRRALPFEFVNAYGPTESSVIATSGSVRAGATSASCPSIGRAVRNTDVYILDDQLRPVPVGVAGEVYIGGEGLARGYWGRPDLTAERFIPDPHSTHSGARMYRTGDLACYTHDADIAFLGRCDDQIKVRGHRIEPGEIAAVLKEVPGVDEAIVQARRIGASPEPVLVAYVVTRPDVGLGRAELRQHVRRRLPDSMVPAAVVFLDRLPLTANGKIDRRALPEPERPTEQAGEPLSTPTEELVGGIWSALLGRDDIGRHSDFFELGGHSLLAAQMIVRLSAACSRDIPLKWAFEYPVLQDLAAHLVNRCAQSDAAAVPAIPRATRVERLPLSLAQERLWFLDQFTDSSSAYNIAGAARLEGAIDRAALEHSLREIVRRHEALRTSFHQVDGRPFQRLHAEVPFEVGETDLRESATGVEVGSLGDPTSQCWPGGPLSRTAPARVTAELQREAAHRFDLAEPGLLRARLLRTGEQAYVLMLVLHHIVADGWSMGVLVRELAALYEAYGQGRLSPLPELPIQYVDYAVWQRERLRDGALAEGLAYWLRQLRGAPETLALPAAQDRGAEATYCGGMVKVDLGTDVSRQLAALSRREGVTLFTTLLAAFQALLSRYTGQHDIVVGTDIANRNNSTIEPLIGFFVNQLVLRTDLGGNPSFRELLARVKSVVLSAWAHQDVPFGSVVEHLRLPRDLSRNPLFQVMVILQNAPIPPLNIPGVISQPIDIDADSSVFDLSLAFVPRGDGDLAATLRYHARIGRATAERMLHDLRSVLAHVVRDPDARLTSLEVSTLMENKTSTPETGIRPDARFKGLMDARPKPAAISTADLVTIGRARDEQALPVVVQPRIGDVDLLAWAARNRSVLLGHLSKTGGLLFRGFGIDSIDRFRALTKTLSDELIEYGERSSPRTKIDDGVYTSTDHPPDQPILLHNEQSYTLNWPRRIWFCCLQPASRGGCTPIADSRRILRRLRPQTAARFVEKQVMYMRNYGDGLGLPWAQVFQTTDRAAVEDYCRRAAIEFEWKDHGRLRTRQIRPAVRTHPDTGESIWFNHLLFFHITSLSPSLRDAITSGVAEDDLPFNTFYGDGTPIEPEVLTEIRDAYEAETVTFPWQFGDVLMLDNMLVAHGREPFSGPRRVVVAMTDPVDAREGAGVAV